MTPPTTSSAKLMKRLEEIVEDEARLSGVILLGLWCALEVAGRVIRGPEECAGLPDRQSL